jgi:hypothetical protein
MRVACRSTRRVIHHRMGRLRLVRRTAIATYRQGINGRAIQAIGFHASLDVTAPEVARTAA